MTAQVLVVDDHPANVKLLEARLMAEYFEVMTAASGPEALEICDRERIDVVLLDVMMPGMDGFEVCRRLKANPRTQAIPVIMVTALDMPEDKINGLEAGADDFLTKPVDEVALITRVKNLARLKRLTDEMLMRAATTERLGLDEAPEFIAENASLSGRILLVEDHEKSAQRMARILASDGHEVLVTDMPQDALFRLNDQDFDLVMVSLNLRSADGLRLCSQIRSLDRTRHLPILIITEPGDEARLLRGLDMGVNDYLIRPVNKQEMLARVATQVKRKRYSDHLRLRLEESVEMSITDALTGLHNRRYMETHLKTLVEEALRRGTPLSLIMADIDYFKSVNDTYGHDVGDIVLKEFARRIRRNTRGIDLVCRLGGEEFVIIMPNTDLGKGYLVAERVRQCIEMRPFDLGGSAGSLKVTASLGVSTIERTDDTPETLLKRADQALYMAKQRGRNQVVAEAA